MRTANTASTQPNKEVDFASVGKAMRSHFFMAEKVFLYLKRSLITAWKSVFFNFKQYACFFIAIMIVQILYGMMSVSADNNNHVEYQHVTEEYNYHLVLRELNEVQAYYLKDKSDPVFKSQKIFDIVDVEENENYYTGGKAYDFYIFLENPTDPNSDPKHYLKVFKDRHLGTLNEYNDEFTEFTMETTSLLNFEENIKANTVTFFFITLLLLAVCIFLLTSLYTIRVNQYKFTYGIYMTFGADFKMLYGTAFWELFIILVVTFIPSTRILFSIGLKKSA